MTDKRPGLSSKSVLNSARSYRSPWIILATAPVLWFWFCIFSDPRNLRNAPWFAIGVLGAAIFFSVQGWEPWNMSIFRGRGRQLQPWEYSPIQEVTADFFRSPRLKWLQGLLIGVGSVLPWALYGLASITVGHPLRPLWRPVPWWTLALLGAGEGIRGRATALYFLAREMERNWPILTKKAAEQPEATAS